jgi:hypothetical protein
MGPEIFLSINVGPCGASDRKLTQWRRFNFRNPALADVSGGTPQTNW